MNEGIYSVNLLAAALDYVDNYDKLSAAIEFADVNDSKSLSTMREETIKSNLAAVISREMISEKIGVKGKS